jgi:hypothetical protein
MEEVGIFSIMRFFRNNMNPRKKPVRPRMSIITKKTKGSSELDDIGLFHKGDE